VLVRLIEDLELRITPQLTQPLGIATFVPGVVLARKDVAVMTFVRRDMVLGVDASKLDRSHRVRCPRFGTNAHYHVHYGAFGKPVKAML
jgi:hypothetical protein